LSPRCLPALIVGFLLVAPFVEGQQPSARWPAPALDDQNYREWLAFIRPRESELRWRKVRWHTTLSGAATEARQLQRPILLWTMNGHPCGET
jgi:hypothetical protein